MHSWGGIPPHLLLLVATGGILLAAGLLGVWFFTRPVSAPARGFAPSFAGGADGTVFAGRDGWGSEERDRVLVLADISGYTRFMTMSRFSLAHAQYVISQLLNGVIVGMKPTVVPAKIEGDAVLGFVPSADAEGPTPAELGDAVVAIAAEFYARREELHHSNVCACNACQAIKSLELKVFVHRGPVLLYELQDFMELSGGAVITIHRLLKNAISKPRYIFVSREAGSKVNLSKSGEGYLHREDYDDVGAVAGTVFPFEIGGLPKPLVPSREAGRWRRFADVAAKLGENLRSLKRRQAEAIRPR